MIPLGFLALAVALRLIGGFSYLRAVITGKARPYPLSWLLWGITPMVTFAAEVSAGVGWKSVITFALGFTPLMVFTISMIKNPKSLKLDSVNALCILLALAGIGLWVITDNPLVAIVVAITADILSSIPTIRKMIIDPKSEYAPTYMLSALSMVVTLLTITIVDWTFAATAFPIYVLVMNTLMVVLIKGKRKKKSKRKPSRRKKR